MQEPVLPISDNKETDPSKTNSNNSASQNNATTRRNAETSEDFSDSESKQKSVTSTLDKLNSRSRKQEEFRIIFDLPEDNLVNDFSCAYNHLNLLRQGRMYISDKHICFDSPLFKSVRHVIPFQIIESIKKTKIGRIFPNAIEIAAKSRKYCYGSFLFRDRAHKILLRAWKKFNGEPVEDDSDGEDEYDDEDTIPENQVKDNPVPKKRRERRESTLDKRVSFENFQPGSESTDQNLKPTAVSLANPSPRKEDGDIPEAGGEEIELSVLTKDKKKKEKEKEKQLKRRNSKAKTKTFRKSLSKKDSDHLTEKKNTFKRATGIDEDEEKDTEAKAIVITSTPESSDIVR
eukprot:TRINITY_DN1400_c0_g7_i2.p1 TRINITY_DN1400_c0_g7~~TRINITY_DN1400_c0_g7_i2.p1  ORF type:complete len:346 (-),score=75.79 TRINITY_DN1400_c0_g7_i2:90-1127(-)